MTINRRLLQLIDRPMPKDQREWSAFVRALVMETPNPASTPDVIGSAVFAVRAAEPSANAASLVDGMRAFLPPSPAPPLPANDAQHVLCAQIFGVH